MSTTSDQGGGRIPNFSESGSRLNQMKIQSKSSTLFGAALLTATCAFSQPASANVALGSLSSHLSIIGGQPLLDGSAIANSVLALVAIMPQGQGLCTASIIAPDLIVTAAHCVTDKAGQTLSPKHLFLLFGTDAQTSTTYIKADAVTVAPGWLGDQSNGIDEHDIGLVYFKTPLPAGYVPATLLPATDSLANAETVTLAGYGVALINDQGGDGAGTLRSAEVTIQNSIYGHTEVLLDQSTGQGACHGDSGGPAYVLKDGVYRLWGITNRGFPDDAPDDCAHQSIYTNIGAYADWITQSGIAFRATTPGPGTSVVATTGL